MRRESKAERAAWTAHIDGKAPKANKYGNERTRGFHSKKEADTAVKLEALASQGIITDLQMQVPIVIVEGRDGIKGVRYIADFVFWQDGVKHIMDAKGMRTQIYMLKKRLLKLLHGITIEEV